jgi:DoxX-like family
MTASSYSAEFRPVFRSRAAHIGGWTLQGLAVAFLAFDAVIKVAQVGFALEGSAALGFDATHVLVLGIVQLTLLVLYVVPTTAILGAVLWTGYLGGAIATHFRLNNPLFSHVLFPIYVAAMLWGGLWLRDARLRSLFPLRAERELR